MEKVCVAIGSAGAFNNDVMQPYDFATPYIKHFLPFVGITDITFFRVEGTAIPGIQEKALKIRLIV